jgi:hypothetical protein
MDEERRTKIVTALHQYRETVSQHSFFLLRILVEGMEAEPFPPGVSVSVAQTLRIEEFCQYRLSGAVPESVKSPRDLLNDDVRAKLVRRARHDGVAHCPVNLKLREEYFAFIRTRIAEKNVEVAQFTPADLESSVRFSAASLVRDCRNTTTCSNLILYLLLEIKS